MSRVERGRYPILSFDTGQGPAEWIPGACAELADGARVHGWDAVSAREGTLLRSVKRAISGLAADAIVSDLPSGPSATELLVEHVAHVLERIRRTLELGP